jgi:hypothetical protein
MKIKKIFTCIHRKNIRSIALFKKLNFKMISDKTFLCSTNMNLYLLKKKVTD